MKRVVSISIIILLCVVMAVPALAAEQYEFYHAPAVLPELDPNENGFGFVCDATIGNGTYVLTFVDREDGFYHSDPFVVEFSFDEENGSYYCLFDVCLDSFDSVPLLGFLILFPGGGTGFSLVGSDGMPVDLFPGVEYVILNSVDKGLDDVISGDMMLDALDQLVSLLPVVLAVIVGCVGLRKAIAWLQNVMRSS